MNTCTFFGHRDAPWKIKNEIRSAVIHMITDHGVDLFLVGDSGNYDKMVKSVLSELKSLYDFDYQVVIFQIPNKSISDCDLTLNVLPDGIEEVPPRFRIEFRNRYMINVSSHAVVYITREYGGAAKFYKIAKNKGLNVIKLSDK